MLGRSTEARLASKRSRRAGRAGYDYLHAAVDDHLRRVRGGPSGRAGETCARFLARAAGSFAEQGVRIEQVMTDNAVSYRRSETFAEVMAALQITHVPIPPTTRGPTARWSGSTGHWPRNGPTVASTGPTPSAFEHSGPGSSSTNTDGPTPRWEAARRSVACEQRPWALQLDPPPTSNPIESTFTPVGAGTDFTRGRGLRMRARHLLQASQKPHP